MKLSPAESLEDFYRNKMNYLPANLQQDIGHFNVFRMEDCIGPHGRPVKYSRRDFYKITLIRGHNRYHYADQSIEVNGSALIFFNPRVPYTWESLSGDYTGYFCIFSKAFFNEKIGTGLKDLPMYAIGGKPAYVLTNEQEGQVIRIFDMMLGEIDSDYAFKYDLLRNYVTELTHLALKSRPTESLYQHPDAPVQDHVYFHRIAGAAVPDREPVAALHDAVGQGFCRTIVRSRLITSTGLSGRLPARRLPA